MSCYLKLTLEELEDKAGKAFSLLSSCTVCARQCRVDRLQGEKGFCRGGLEAAVSSWGQHFGEEDVLVGRYGSGTIFFTYCNLACCFCQNYEISSQGAGRLLTVSALAGAMLELQELGCHNINLVSPSHFVPQILKALVLAVPKGLRIPLVYNTGGYDSIEALQLLEGVVDIYMPDLKYGDDHAGEKYSSVPDYFTVAKEAVKEMHRQVGDLVVSKTGVAERGLLVRHLLLPEGLAGTGEVVRFIAEEISQDTFLNIMDQYYPAHKAMRHKKLSRRVTPDEVLDAVNIAREAGLERIYL
ncbi:MAG: Radical SAM domain protein [Desulfotomaculum sp. 46_296]|nr:MAG: Radical SAM domain protein [Desulfotomaculum sp. 46_296]HAU30980.1 radical SAM protein [Desulfotomaculum sp.]